LQVYCDEWLRRPIAREYGIAQITVDDKLMLAVNLDAERADFVGENVFIPIDELLGYIIDHHLADSVERQQLHASVRDDRSRWAELHRDYEATIGRAGKLYLICKSCEAALETHHTAVEGQTIECPACSVTCPACGQSHYLRWLGSGIKAGRLTTRQLQTVIMSLWSIALGHLGFSCWALRRADRRASRAPMLAGRLVFWRLITISKSATTCRAGAKRCGVFFAGSLRRTA
jgi:hypothetical protein